MRWNVVVAGVLASASCAAGQDALGLVEALRAAPTPAERARLAGSIGASGPGAVAAAPALGDLLRDGALDPDSRAAILWALASIGRDLEPLRDELALAGDRTVEGRILEEGPEAIVLEVLRSGAGPRPIVLRTRIDRSRVCAVRRVPPERRPVLDARCELAGSNRWVPLRWEVEADGRTTYRLARTGRFQVGGDVSPRALEDAARELEAAWRTFEFAFAAPGRGGEPVSVLLVERPERFRRIQERYLGGCPFDSGFYLPRERLAVVLGTTGTSERTRALRHETFHAFARDRLALPPWLEEGLAMHLETCAFDGRSLSPGRAEPCWLAAVKEAHRTGRLVPFEDLRRARPIDLVPRPGDGRAALLALEAWYLVRLLAERGDPRDVLTRVDAGALLAETLPADDGASYRPVRIGGETVLAREYFRAGRTVRWRSRSGRYLDSIVPPSFPHQEQP